MSLRYGELAAQSCAALRGKGEGGEWALRLEARALQVASLSLFASSRREAVDSVRQRLVAQSIALGERAVVYLATGSEGGARAASVRSGEAPAEECPPDAATSWPACFHLGLCLLNAGQVRACVRACMSVCGYFCVCALLRHMRVCMRLVLCSSVEVRCCGVCV